MEWNIVLRIIVVNILGTHCDVDAVDDLNVWLLAAESDKAGYAVTGGHAATGVYATTEGVLALRLRDNEGAR